MQRFYPDGRYFYRLVYTLAQEHSVNLQITFEWCSALAILSSLKFKTNFYSKVTEHCTFSSKISLEY